MEAPTCSWPRGGHHRLRALKELGRLRKKQQRRRKEARTVTPTRMRQTLRVHETPIYLRTCVASEESQKCACQEDRFLQHTKSTRLRGCTAAERGNDRGIDAELQDGAERLKRGLAFPAGSLRAPGPAAADAGREEGVNNNCEKNKHCTKSCVCMHCGRRGGRGRGCWNDSAGAPGLFFGWLMARREGLSGMQSGFSSPPWRATELALRLRARRE